MNSQKIRETINNALPGGGSSPETPRLGNVYVPKSHVKALRLDSSLVVGSRGAGKTFWSAALRDKSILKILGAEVLNIENTDVYIGFSEKLETNYPDKNTFKQLLSKEFDAYDVWRGVIARWAAGKLSKNVPSACWAETVEWTIDNPEPFSTLLRKLDESFGNRKSYGLIVFDALDRASAVWEDADRILKGLLMVSLEMKSFQNIFSKVFLRDDQYKRPGVTSFPDASKLVSNRVELNWTAQDLYGLLWQYLCNAEGQCGETLRHFIERNGTKIEQTSGVWAVEAKAKNDEKTQRKIFEAIAGQWMGRNSRRGNTYDWCVNHLADGYGKTSPRSFITAIKKASEDERYQDHEYPLHYESIKRGVQEASEIRVLELKEDFPWVGDVMPPLKGLNVPCGFADILGKWKSRFKNTKPEKIFDEKDRLPPAHCKENWEGIRLDLEALGIFAPTRDNRINMPDLYRIAFEIGRKGGVPPKPKNE